MKGIATVGEWEREIQVASCNLIVFNGKRSPKVKPDIILGALFKKGSAWTSRRGSTV